MASPGMLQRAMKKSKKAHKSRYAAYENPRAFQQQQAREAARKKQAKDLGAKD